MEDKERLKNKQRLKWFGFEIAASNGGLLLALGTLIGGLLIAIIFLAFLLPEAGVDTTPTSSDSETVPSFGVEGFNTEVFCKDDETKVVYLPMPDGGKRYQLTRIKDGRLETVEFNELAPTGKYFYYDTAGQQQDRPAEITKDARDCMTDKGELFIPNANVNPSAPAPISPNQPSPDIFACGSGCNMQLLNPLTVKAKANKAANYRLLTMPSCSSGTIPNDLVKLEIHMAEQVKFTLRRNDSSFDFTVRINCGNDQIITCGSIYIFCLGRGFPYNPDVDLSDILSSYQEETRLSIPCHEICGHAIATWDEQYCKGIVYPSGHPCYQQAQFAPTPNWADFMNTGVLSRHGFTALEKDRWERTMYPLTQEVCFGLDPCYSGGRWRWASLWSWELATDCWHYSTGACYWQRADSFGWRYSPVLGIALKSGTPYFHGASGLHLIVP